MCVGGGALESMVEDVWMLEWKEVERVVMKTGLGRNSEKEVEECVIVGWRGWRCKRM